MNTLGIKQFKYLVIFEVIIGVISIINYLPALIIFISIISLFLLYQSFQEPVFALLLLMFSILAGSLGVVKFNGKAPPILFADIIFPIIVSILIIKSLYSEKNKDSYTSLSLYWIPFLIWGLLGFIIGVDKIRVLLIWKSYFAGFISFTFAYFAIQKGKHVKIIFVSFIIWGIILASIEFFVLMQLGGLGHGLVDIFFRKNLVATSWGRSNYLATFYDIIVPLTLGYFLTINSLKAKLFSGLSLLIMMSAEILTLSRGGILSLTIAIIFFLSRVIKPRTFFPILGALILVIGIILLNPLTYVLIQGLMTVDNSFSYFTRVNFYKDVVNMFLRNPIYGVGLGNLGFHSTFVLKTQESAHNIVLGMLGETGIIGAIFFFTLLGKIIFELFKSYMIEKNDSLKILKWALISSFVGALIHSMMEPNFEGFQFSIMVWILVALFMKIKLLNFDDLKLKVLKSG